MNPFEHVKNLHTKKSLKRKIQKEEAIRKFKKQQEDE